MSPYEYPIPSGESVTINTPAATDKTNDTYVAEDADGTPCLWLQTPGSGMNELLASKDDVRVMVNRHKPNASWGAPSRDVYVDRLWDAIAATAGEAPKDDADA